MLTLPSPGLVFSLEHTFRGSNILASLRGDEFAALALEASTQCQEAILRPLEKSLKKSNANQSRYEMSLSVALARFGPKHPVSLGELMAQGDQAMYEQKRVDPEHAWANPSSGMT